MLRPLFSIDESIVIYEREQPGLFGAFSDYYWGEKDSPSKVVGPFSNTGTAIRDYERYKAATAENPNTIHVDFKARSRILSVKS